MTIFRLVANLFIAVFWLWAFGEWEWISFVAEKPLFVALLPPAFLIWLIESILDRLQLLLVTTSCLLGCFTFLIFTSIEGWILLNVIANLTNWFVINESFFWIGLLMSIAIGMMRFPAIRVRGG